jgi:YVTN family beta-propeller protein
MPRPESAPPTFGVLATRPIGQDPQAAVFDPAVGFDYVINSASNNVTVLNNTSILASIPVGAYPSAAAVDTADGYVYVVNSASNNVTVLNGSTVVGSPSVGFDPTSVVYDPADGYVYVADLGDGTVTVLNGTSVQASVPVGNFTDAPYALAFDVADGDVYATEVGSTSAVAVLNGTSLRTTIPIVPTEAYPSSVLFDPSDNDVYALDSGSGNVSILSGMSVLTTVSVGADPVAAAYDSGDGAVYILNSGSDNATILDGTAVSGTVPLPFAPAAGTYDPGAGDLVIVGGYGNVAVVQGSAEVQGLAVGSAPAAVSFDPALGYAYVADAGSNAVSVIGYGAFYNLSFAEVGLPVGSLWYVAISSSSTGSAVNGSLGNVTSFIVPDGTYRYAIANNTTAGAYAPTPASGTLTVLGANATVNVTFAPVGIYNLTFSETGLPAGTPWTVGISNSSVGALSNGSTSAVIGFSVANGTYAYLIADVSVGAGISLPTPSAGLTIVNGTATNVSVTFALAAQYNVTFNETGLPIGTPWQVELLNASTGLLTNGSTNGSIGFEAPNGSYNFTIGNASVGVGLFVPSPATGVVPVMGSNVTVTIVFAPAPEYNLTLVESGLPGSTLWVASIQSVSIGTEFNASTNGSLGFVVPNGTYAFAIANASANGSIYVPTPATGTRSVDGANITVPVIFELLREYNVTFNETGLPGGTVWSVELCGPSTGCSVNGSTNGSIDFLVPNGQYTYAIAGIAGYDAAPSGGPTTVSGANVTVDVLFTVAEYTITITATGLPGGTEWWVNVTGGPSTSSTGSTVVLSEPNGTYLYTVATADKRYSATGGSLPVSGTPLAETAAFSLVTYEVTYTLSGLTLGTTWWVNVTGGPSTVSTTSTLSFVEANGSYLYTVATTDKEYAASPGSLSVDGSVVSKTAAFSLVTYAVTFTETGLPPGTNWSVTVGGVLKFSTAGSISFDEPNGSYSFTSTTLGYTNGGGRFSVDGPSSGSVPVPFSAIPPSSSPAAPAAPNYYWIGGGVAIGAIGMGIAAVLLGRRKKPDPEIRSAAPESGEGDPPPAPP